MGVKKRGPQNGPNRTQAAGLLTSVFLLWVLCVSVLFGLPVGCARKHAANAETKREAPKAPIGAQPILENMPNEN